MNIEVCSKCRQRIDDDKKLDENVWNCPVCGIESQIVRCDFLFNHYHELGYSIEGHRVRELEKTGGPQRFKMTFNGMNNTCELIIAGNDITLFSNAFDYFIDHLTKLGHTRDF